MWLNRCLDWVDSDSDRKQFRTHIHSSVELELRLALIHTVGRWNFTFLSIQMNIFILLVAKSRLNQLKIGTENWVGLHFKLGVEKSAVGLNRISLPATRPEAKMI